MNSINQPKPSLTNSYSPQQQSLFECETSAAAQQEYLSAHHYLLNRINYEHEIAVAYQERHYKLQRMRTLLELLGDPQQGQRIVHIAGTKGKGSTAAMIASILSTAGLRTGVYSSPHLHCLEERMAIDGVACSSGEFVRLIEKIKPVVAEMDRAAIEASDIEIGPTYFEITTALALMHFAENNVDATILEVGLGGRLDSTNVCETQLSVITSISLDHTQQLGDTLELIAEEKAGIIKPKVPVISGVKNASANQVIKKMAGENSCCLLQVGSDFDFSHESAFVDDDFTTKLHYFANANDKAHFTEYELQLLGEHQAANAAVAITAARQLQQMGWGIPTEAIHAGLRKTTCPARIEIARKNPFFIVDTAHNVASIKALVKVLQESFRPAAQWLIFATSRDKDIAGMLTELIPQFDHIVFTKYESNPRTVSPEQLRAIAETIENREYLCLDTPGKALEYVQVHIQPNQLACIAGSFFLAAELRNKIEV